MKPLSQIIWEHYNGRPFDTENYIEISKIVCPQYFLNSNPRTEKIKRYYKRYKRNGYLDEPLTVKTKAYNNEYHIILKNGYIRYLIIWSEIKDYMEKHNLTYKNVPDKMKLVPVKWVE